MKYDERASREREQYNQGLQRKRYNNVWLHCIYSKELQANNLKKHLSYGHGTTVLEIGSSTWKNWLEPLKIYPAHLDCINISEKELERGRKNSESTNIKPVFHLMDAHDLLFEDECFDMVYGSMVLHHLELTQALKEIHRVLKPNGIMAFAEPLDTNPIAKLVRYLTPKTRTVDEQPFRFKELATLKRFFDISVDTYEFFSVPFGILSLLIFKHPRNPITYTAYVLDRTTCLICPPMKWFYRRMTMYGNKYNNTSEMS